MSENELWTKLERALHTRITAAERQDLREAEMLSMYAAGSYVSWDDFKDDVAHTLRRLRRFLVNSERERVGDLLLVTETDEEEPEIPSVTGIFAPLSERTAARAQALIALDNYELGPTNPDRVRSRTITSKVRPQGGFDETLPQWVIELQIEAWVPADDVRNIYQYVQRDLLAEKAGPKTQPRTYNVAQFVWEQKLRHGERLTWPALFERWKERYPDDEGFKDWRAFYKCFERGEEATPPRYVDSSDYIASEARRLRRAREQWEEGGPWFGLRPS
jgi:hypothetical protein